MGLFTHSIAFDSFKCIFSSAEKGRNTLKFQKYVYYVKKKKLIHLLFTLADLFNVTVGQREVKY